MAKLIEVFGEIINPDNIAYLDYETVGTENTGCIIVYSKGVAVRYSDKKREQVKNEINFKVENGF